MTEEQIDYMVNRFLCWKLPENFSPDNGISYEGPIGNKGYPGMEYKREPSGTNLFGYTEARAMVLHMIEGLPEGPIGDVDFVMVPFASGSCE